jgi:hypothetical protein
MKPINRMRQLAKDSGLSFSGEEDNRLFLGDEHIHIFAHLMSAKAYKAYELETHGAEIKGEGFTAYANIDESGYTFWKKAGERGDPNYISVCVAVNDISKVDASEINRAAYKIFNSLLKWSNLDAYFDSKERRGAK